MQVDKYIDHRCRWYMHGSTRGKQFCAGTNGTIERATDPDGNPVTVVDGCFTPTILTDVDRDYLYRVYMAPRGNNLWPGLPSHIDNIKKRGEGACYVAAAFYICESEDNGRTAVPVSNAPRSAAQTRSIGQQANHNEMLRERDRDTLRIGLPNLS